MKTDTSEKGLESLIVATMTGDGGHTHLQTGTVKETSAGYGGSGWIAGDPSDYDRE
jgi:type I restriction enzyme R subunit